MEQTERTTQNDRKYMTRKAISVAWPAMAESFFVTLAGMIDTMMVSEMGPAAVAAVGLVGQPRMIMLCLFFALNVGITAVVARRRGEKRQDAANATVRTAIVICIALSALLMAILIPLATPLMRFAGAEAFFSAAFFGALAFFKAFGAFFTAFFAALLAFLFTVLLHRILLIK